MTKAGQGGITAVSTWTVEEEYPKTMDEQVSGSSSGVLVPYNDRSELKQEMFFFTMCSLGSPASQVWSA